MTKPNQTDQILLATPPADFTKTAVLISQTYDACIAAGIPATDTLAKDIAERLYILVDNGALECKGNMRRWRESEIRQIKKA